MGIQQKVIGYFSYTAAGTVACDGDACIITSSENMMQKYLAQMPAGPERNIIKKTRFGEVMYGLEKGAAYAFDENAYRRILPLLERSGIDYLPSADDFFSVKSPAGLSFIRIQLISDHS